MRRLLALLLLTPLACGPLACGPAGGKDAAHPQPVASSAAPKPKTPPDRALCERACAYETKCGAPAGECEKRCLIPAHLLQTEVLEVMAACIEKQTPATCDKSEEAAKARNRVKVACLIEATDQKREEAIANTTVFADAHCEKTKECGVDGVFQKNECVGRARASIGDSPEAPLIGALRPTSVDEVVVCLRSAKCEARSADAGLNISKCIDTMLTSGSEP